MKLYVKIGNYLFDYLVLTILLIISGLLIIPLYAIIVGIVAFFETGANYKVIFTTIKENFKLILLLTILMLFLGSLIVLSLFIIKSLGMDIITIIIICLLIFLMVLLIIYPPIIILKMNVTFKQLLRNTVYLTLVQFKYTIIMLILSGLIIYLSIYQFWFLLLVVPWLQSIHYISNKTINIEKEKKGIGEEI
ncbi:MAG: hypothetical protein GX931_01255 [Acholeplasmataceae bacterium]|nr:hypothetical protein [Acholeplasmataceae bacterium]